MGNLSISRISASKLKKESSKQHVAYLERKNSQDEVVSTATTHGLRFHNEREYEFVDEAVGFLCVDGLGECTISKSVKKRSDKGGYTVVYRYIPASASVSEGRQIEFSYSTCHKNDTFDKVIGMKVALSRFLSGEVFQLRWHSDKDLNYFTVVEIINEFERAKRKSKAQ